MAEGDQSGRCLDLTSFLLHDLADVELPEILIELDLTGSRLSELDPRIAVLSQFKKLSLRQNLFDDRGVEAISNWDAISGLEASSPKLFCYFEADLSKSPAN